MRWIRNHLYLILVYGTFIISGSFWLAQRIKFHEVREWPSVDAHIIEHGNENYTLRSEDRYGSGMRSHGASYVLFEYMVDGQPYLSNLATPDGGGLPVYPTMTVVDESGRSDAAARQWRAFYKPTSPKTAVLVPTTYRGTTRRWSAAFWW